ncbi:MAG: hypothetical protein PHN84_03325 [Desulfuromonadaceae bacterium]|nr:hypothetical protein [Desulfuromonadaceae bacterium]
MKVNSRNHVYRYTPNFLDNRQLPADQQIVISLRAVTSPDEDDYQREALANLRTFAPDKAQELNEARHRKLITEKFVCVEGLEIGGLEGKPLDYDTFYAEAPAEIVNEVLRAIRSVEMLTNGEQKNFLPVPDGH